MNIIFLTKNMENYDASSYQMDVIKALKKKSKLFLYGPGYKYFNYKDTIDDIEKKSGTNNDFIIFGHSFLSDSHNILNDPMPNLDNQNSRKLTKIAILNKEYVNLEYKLNYYKSKKVQLCFTHHHQNQKYEKITGIKFIFWPFAVDFEKFDVETNHQKYDLSFTGVLQNLNLNADQTDLRLRIMKLFYFSIGDINLIKRKKYSKYNIFWNSIPRNALSRHIKNALLSKKRLNDSEYVSLLNSSRVFLNTLSPVQLISPRYFECLASNAVILCEKTHLYSNIFEQKYYVEFKNDLSNFDEMFNEALLKSKDTEYLSKAKKYVQKNHTWDIRINYLIENLARI